MQIVLIKQVFKIMDGISKAELIIYPQENRFEIYRQQIKDENFYKKVENIGKQILNKV